MVVLGLVVANRPLDLIDWPAKSEAVKLLTELALTLVLFDDASRVNLRWLRADPGVPTRLLLSGLPLTIGAGFLAATVMTDLDPWLCRAGGHRAGPYRCRARRAGDRRSQRADADRAHSRRREWPERRPGDAPGEVLARRCSLRGREPQWVAPEGRPGRPSGGVAGRRRHRGRWRMAIVDRAQPQLDHSCIDRRADSHRLRSSPTRLALQLDANGIVAAFVGGSAYGRTETTLLRSESAATNSVSSSVWSSGCWSEGSRSISSTASPGGRRLRALVVDGAAHDTRGRRP